MNNVIIIILSFSFYNVVSLEKLSFCHEEIVLIQIRHESCTKQKTCEERKKKDDEERRGGAMHAYSTKCLNVEDQTISPRCQCFLPPPYGSHFIFTTPIIYESFNDS
jgi:hypothetical protein